MDEPIPRDAARNQAKNGLRDPCRIGAPERSRVARETSRATIRVRRKADSLDFMMHERLDSRLDMVHKPLFVNETFPKAPIAGPSA
jgi:hypothetical protein